MKVLLKKIIAIIMIMIISVNTATMHIVANDVIINTSSEFSEKEMIYEGEGFKVTYEVTSTWNTGYNVAVSIENTGKDDILNWAIQFEEDDKIENIWNAEIIEYKNYIYSIKNAGWNQDILVGETVSFGFTASGSLDYLPNIFSLPVYKEEVSNEKYDSQMKLINEWNSGYQAELIVNNNSDEKICNWFISFNYDRDITQVFNGEIVEHVGNRYTIKHCSYNRNIEADSTLSIGIMGNEVENSIEIKNVKIIQSVIDISDEIQLEDGVINKAFLIRNVLMPLQLEQPELEISDIKLSDDHDCDGLILIEEYNNGTDPLNSDSDGDRIDDYTEISIGTNPIYVDSDGDGMFDGTEIEVSLNPLSKDSDNDGIFDNEECTTQYITYIHKNDLSNNDILVNPHISITGKGDFNRKIHIEEKGYDATISGLEYIVGSPFEFLHADDMEFECSTLYFEINDRVLADTNMVDLAVAYYNEEIGCYEILETEYDIEKQVIFAQVEHYSTYAVINQRKYINMISTNLFDKNTVPNMNNNVIYNGSLYLIFDEGISWIEASEKCYELGGHLVTIESCEEQEFLDEFMKQRGSKNFYWIGLTGLDNQYAWITGEKLLYNNWAKDEPNNLDENYVHMYAKSYDRFECGQWNDTFNCFEVENAYYHVENNGYICEIEHDAVTPEGKYPIILVDGRRIYLDKNPELGDYTVDTDGDGVSDIDELGTKKECKVYDQYTKRTISFTGYTYISNPVRVDTDDDGIGDGQDCNPKKYDVTIVDDVNNAEILPGFYGRKLYFNTGKVWTFLNMSAEEYNANWWYACGAKYSLARIIVQQNAEYEFCLEELMAIAMDVEGIRVYLDQKRDMADQLFVELYGRKPISYQHTGNDEYTILGYEDYGEGTYDSGIIISEAEAEFTLRPYNLVDKYYMRTLCRNVVKSIFTNIVLELAGYVVFTAGEKLIKYNVENLRKFMESRGIKEGYRYYKKYAVATDWDGALSGLQKNIDDIDINVPYHAKEVAKKVKANNGVASDGYKGGAIYNNIPKEAGGQTLPDGVIYKEYDVYPSSKLDNMERIIIGDDGSVWYTRNHYYTFEKVDVGVVYGYPNETRTLLDRMSELSGTTRDKLLGSVQNQDLYNIVDQLYRPGATIGDGGTAAILVDEFNNGISKHLQKATERLQQLKVLQVSEKLVLKDLDIIEALIDDLEYAVGLFK